MSGSPANVEGAVRSRPSTATDAELPPSTPYPPGGYRHASPAPAVKIPVSTAPPTSRIGTPRASTAALVEPPGAPSKTKKKKTPTFSSSTRLPAPAIPLVASARTKEKERYNAADRAAAAGPVRLPPSPPQPKPSASTTIAPVSESSETAARERVRFTPSTAGSPAGANPETSPRPGPSSERELSGLERGRPGIIDLAAAAAAFETVPAPSGGSPPRQPQVASRSPVMGATPSPPSPWGTPGRGAPPRDSSRYDSARREAGVHQPPLPVEPNLSSPSGLPLSGLPEPASSVASDDASASQSRSRGGMSGRPLQPTSGIDFDPDAVQPYVEELLVKSSLEKISLYERILQMSRFPITKHLIEDLGVRLPEDHIQIYRFKLGSEMLDELSYQTRRVQGLTDAVARYIRRPYFNSGAIDPGGHLYRSLQGCSEVEHLHVDYKILTKRLLDAAERIRQLDGRTHVSETAISPIRTASSWAADLAANEGGISPSVVTKVYLSHPRMSESLSADANRVVQDWVKSNEQSLPSAGWSPLRNVLMPSPTLSQAFPLRQPEPEPRKLVYPVDSDEPMTVFQSGASSYGQAKSWRVPALATDASRSAMEEREVENLLNDDPVRYTSRRHPSRGERRERGSSYGRESSAVPVAENIKRWVRSYRTYLRTQEDYNAHLARGRARALLYIGALLSFCLQRTAFVPPPA
jgi:hypothetical protein